MDNITHSLAGAVLGQAGLKRKTRKGLAALVLGANGPDIDVFFGWVSWLPLATHRGFTHGIIGALIVMPLVVAGFLWLLDKWQLSTGRIKPDALPMDWRWLLGLSLLGNITHPLLDLQTTYAVQLLSPFSTAWFHTDSLFIIDLVLLVLLGTSVWLSSRRDKAARADWFKPARIGFMGMLAYIGLNLAITQLARRDVEAAVPGGFDHFVASPQPVAFWRRNLVWRKDSAYQGSSFDPLGSPRISAFAAATPSNIADPLVAEAIKASPRIAQFLRWSIMPMVTIKRATCTAVLTFNDARYSQGVSRGSFHHEVTLPNKGVGCP